MKDSNVILYWSNVDCAFHLYGAKDGCIDIDYNDDNITDLRLEMMDTDDDNVFDLWTFRMSAGEESFIKIRSKPTIETYEVADVGKIYLAKLNECKITRQKKLAELKIKNNILAEVNNVFEVDGKNVSSQVKLFFKKYASLYVTSRASDIIKNRDDSGIYKLIRSKLENGEANYAHKQIISTAENNKKCGLL